MTAGVYTYRERRIGNMWFLVVFSDNGVLQPAKVNLTQLLNKFDFGNYYGDVVQFTQSAGIGDHIKIKTTCVIVRTR